jgi:hypothetical protein
MLLAKPLSKAKYPHQFAAHSLHLLPYLKGLRLVLYATESRAWAPGLPTSTFVGTGSSFPGSECLCRDLLSLDVTSYSAAYRLGGVVAYRASGANPG